jgi:hypothetical protein
MEKKQMHIGTIETVRINNRLIRLEKFDGDTSGGFWYSVYANELHGDRPATSADSAKAFCHGTNINNLARAAMHFDRLVEQNRCWFRDRIYADDAIAPELLDEFPPNQFINWPVG